MAPAEIDWNPDERKLRQFAVAWLIAFGVAGLVVAWRAGRGPWTWPIALWGLAAAVGLCGTVMPRAVLWIYRGWTALAFPLGWVVNHVLLAAIYFGLFTPITLVFRLIGRDALQRRFPSDADSCWIKRSGRSDRDRYFRQF